MMSQHDSAFAERDRSEPEEGRSHLWTLTGRRLTWITAAASFVLCLALIPSWYLSRPPPGYWLYAAAMDALDDVETVHAHGYGTAFMFERYKLDSAERYELDMWAWVADDGTIRSYDRRGPIVEWDDGERRYEHFGHQDSLYVHKSLYVRKSRLGKSARRPGTHLVMKRRLAELNDSDADFVDLGEHPQNGRLVRIVRKEVPEDKRKEWWFDIESHLIVHETHYKWKDARWALWWDLSITYDEDVPDDVAGYAVPNTGNVHYDSDIGPQYEPWRRHLQRLSALYTTRPLPEIMELLPREPGVEVETANGSSLPGHRGYHVYALSRDVHRLLFNSHFEAGTLRVARDIARIKLSHDLIVRRSDDEGEWIEETPDSQQRIEFVLEKIGLEVAETKEERVVLVAQYDGRRLKPWRKIQAPISGGAVQAGVMNGSSSEGISARRHIRLFNLQYDYDLSANRPLLIDETGLPEDTPLSEISVSWHGPGALEIAQQWFETEFGITFEEERRVMTVFTVKRRE